MKYTIVFTLLICIMLVIVMMNLDIFTNVSNIVVKQTEPFGETDLIPENVKKINLKYGFTVPRHLFEEFINILKNEELIKMIKTMVKTDFTYKGGFADGPNRRIPTYRGQVVRGRQGLSQCINIANKTGHSIAALQYYGQCFTGTDLVKATSYGKSVSSGDNTSSPYFNGVGWNNQVYAKGEAIVNTIDTKLYSEIIEWLTSEDIGVKNYDQFKELIALLNGDLPQGFTTIEGLVPATPPTVPSILASNTKGYDSNPKIVEISKRIQTAEQNIKIDFISGETTISTITQINQCYRKYDKAYVNMIFSLLNFDTSTSVDNFNTLLQKIGLNGRSYCMIDYIFLLGNYGRIANNNGKYYISVDDDFISHYTKIGLNSETDTYGFFNKLLTKNIIHNVNNSNADIHKITYPYFAGTIQEYFGIINYTQMYEFFDIIDGFYTPTDSDNFKLFCADVIEFNQPSIGKRETPSIDILKNFKKVLGSYKTSYTEYRKLNYGYLNNVVLNKNKQSFLQKFTYFYNKFYIAKDANPIPITTAEKETSLPLYVSLTEMLSLMIDREIIKTNGTSKLNLENKIDEFINLEMYKGSVSLTRIVIDPFTVNVIESAGNQGFTTFESFTEGATGTIRIQSILKSLNDMGFDTVSTIYVKLNETDIQPTNISVQQLYDFITQTIGASSDEHRVLILSYMATIQPGSDLVICLKYFKNFGINMSNFKDVTSAFDNMKIKDYKGISEFLKRIIPFGITFQNIEPFTKTLRNFGVVYEKSPSNFISLLDTLLFYNITYKTSVYDSKNTKLDNFVNNCMMDGMNFNAFNNLLKPILKYLNNGIDSNSPKSASQTGDEKDKNLRDFIIYRNSLFIGISDNPIPEIPKSLISNWYGGALSPNFNPKFDITDYKILQCNNCNVLTIFKFLPKYVVDANGKGVPQNASLFSEIEILYASIFSETYFKWFMFDKIMGLLTVEEYIELKRSPPNLVERSVMSRLLVLLMKEAMSKGTTTIEGVTHYNGYTDTINLIRIIPYKTFNVIRNEILSAKQDLTTKLTKYDLINNPENRTSNSNGYVQPAVKESFSSNGMLGFSLW